jgi:hypothetical protein
VVSKPRQSPAASYDFSQVRIHTDGQAAESAAAIGALAYTAGRDIVFATGRYEPASEAGRRLLAHELAHVAQHGQAPQANPGVVRRKGGTVGGFFSNIFQAISSGFADDTLQDYLTFLGTSPEIEDDFDSDNKALAVVEHWRAGTDKTRIRIGEMTFPLTSRLRGLLIEELLTGNVGADETKAAQDLRAAAPVEKPKETKAGEAEKGPDTAEQGPTPAEQGAAKLREKSRGQVETQKAGARTFQVGGVRANARAQADVRSGILINREDAAHIQFFGDRLGVDAAHQSSADPFRWNALVKMVQEGQVEILAVSPSSDIKCNQIGPDGKTEPFDGNLTLLGGNGVTVVRPEISNLLGRPVRGEGKRLISLTGRDQVHYRPGHSAMAHELFGHVWLAMHGVPFGHGQELKGTQSIVDPFGEKYTGSVNDYVESFVQRPDRQPESLTLNVTEKSLQASLEAFLTAAADPKAFTFTRSMITNSPEIRGAWARLKSFYAILLANRQGEEKRLKKIVEEIRSVYGKYDKDHREAFDRFMFAKADIASSKPNPEAHLVRALGIQNPNTNP